MKFAQWIFRTAGVYGILVTTPLYFSEDRLGVDFPPPIAHPEYFYGFIGVTLAWQILFLFLSTDPVRYRLLMLPSILEKVSYGLAAVWLFSAGRIGQFLLNFALIDLVFAGLFLASYVKTPERRPGD